MLVDTWIFHEKFLKEILLLSVQTNRHLPSINSVV